MSRVTVITVIMSLYMYMYGLLYEVIDSLLGMCMVRLVAMHSDVKCDALLTSIT